MAQNKLPGWSRPIVQAIDSQELIPVNDHQVKFPKTGNFDFANQMKGLTHVKEKRDQQYWFFDVDRELGDPNTIVQRAIDEGLIVETVS